MFNDNEQFINQFVIETEEHLQSIENNLVLLENNLSNQEFDSNESVNELFRSIHTIKGLSGMLEFNNLFNLTHLWESLLDQIRKKTKELDKDIIDVSFQGLEILTSIIDNIRGSGTDAGISITSILLLLEKISSHKVEEEIVEKLNISDLISFLSKPLQNTMLDFEKNKLIGELESGKNIYEIVLYLNKDCFEKDMSYISTCINLEFLGEIINISPNVFSVPTLENFDPENFDLEIYILFASTKDEERIYSILKNREIKVNQVHFKKTEINNQGLEINPENNLKKDFSDNSLKTPDKDMNFEISEVNNKVDKKENPNKYKPNKSNNQETIRVETSRLDTLLTLLGEQVISKTQLEQLTVSLKEVIDESENNSIEKIKIVQLYDILNEKINNLSKLSNELQNTVMSIRMLPIGNVFNRFNKIVRDLSRELGKNVELEIEGEETELDKTIIEEISDPLMHIIRNAIDHGIEMPKERIAMGKSEYGTLNFNAYQQGNNIVITIKDDGKGLNVPLIKAKAIEKGLLSDDETLSENEIINVIFEPGFSTTSQVTGISGRGVGMDVVRQNIRNLKGTIDIDTIENKGTTFTIKLPLTLAIIQALLIKVNEKTYAIPLNSVIESYRANKNEIKYVNNRPVLKLRERILPVLYFQDYFKFHKEENTKEFLYIVVVGIAEYRVGFVVDTLVGQKEIVIKPFNDPLVKVKGIGGATLIGEEITLILDTAQIISENKNGKKLEKVNS